MSKVIIGILLAAFAGQIQAQGQLEELFARASHLSGEARPSEGWVPAELQAEGTAFAKSPGLELIFNYPETGTARTRLIEKIEGAAESILVNSHAITDEQIIYALIRARFVRNVKVVALLEPVPDIRNYSVPHILAKNHIPTFFCNAEGRNHNNYIIIDGKQVMVGQMLTHSANRQAFGALLFTDKKIVQAFTIQYSRHLSYSSPFEGQDEALAKAEAIGTLRNLNSKGNP